MVRAFGYCHESFAPLQPGRLCRGRERWLEGTPDMPDELLSRTVMSGAVFSDDSARDAQRGFSFSGINAGRLLTALFPGHGIWGYAENGDPRALPARMSLEEDQTQHLWGGHRRRPVVRWLAQSKLDDVDAWMLGEQNGLAAPKADAFVLLKGQPSETLISNLFLLCGYGDPEDRPARTYNPTALPALLQEAAAVVLLHLDKHSPVMALYTRTSDGGAAALDSLLCSTARVAGAFPVPFAIPPMLARWDRALYELRMRWDSAQDGDFPVPPAEDAGGRWSMRRRIFEESERTGDIGAGAEHDRQDGDSDMQDSDMQDSDMQDSDMQDGDMQDGEE